MWITDSTGEQAEVCCVVAEALRKRKAAEG